VATGDLLFSRAFAELAEEGEGEGADRQVELLAHASVALARGELAQRADAYDTRVSIERYTHRCNLKTAALFECACVIGAEREPGDERALIAFGREIGLAFQLLDDVLDVLGPPERTGKARGTDLLDGTVTLPFILARERDPSLADLDLRSLLVDEAADVCDRIAATGAAEQVRADARDRVAAAKAGLRDAGIAGAELELLELVADGVVERYS
jgi:geranylgeranyl pyrophosphate synthase